MAHTPSEDDHAATTPSRLDVVAIGNALVDVLAPSTDEVLARLGLVKGTMALVDLERSRAIYEAMGPTTEASGGSPLETVKRTAEELSP